MPQQPGRRDLNASLVVSLAAGASAEEAGRAAGCCTRTVERRCEDPTFVARVKALRAEMVQAAAGRLAALGAQAADKLGELLDDDRSTVQLGACRCILEYLLKSRELLEVEERLAAVEEALKARGGRK
jgi:hypothetical protein